MDREPPLAEALHDEFTSLFSKVTSHWEGW